MLNLVLAAIGGAFAGICGIAILGWLFFYILAKGDQ